MVVTLTVHAAPLYQPDGAIGRRRRHELTSLESDRRRDVGLH